MVYKNFKLNCAIRVILAGASVSLFFYLVFQTSLYMTAVIVGLLALYQFYAIFRYIEKTNVILARFLDSIKYSDFTQSFTTGQKGTAFERLHQAFNGVITEFKRARSEKEEHFHYLQTVVQHVGVGLIAFNAKGEIQLINNAAKRLLKIPSLKNISQLSALSAELSEKILEMKGDSREQVKIQRERQSLLLSLQATKFALHQEGYTLVSLQNIRWELEEKEMEAWHSLIRTLTHEIMNSIAPISSLASTAKELMLRREAEGNENAGEDELKDTITALKTIEKRSEGLMAFVENYRKLYRIPKPEFEIFPAQDLFGRVIHLMREDIESKGIGFSYKIDPESLELTADPALIEQVMINLLKNSVEAIGHRKDSAIEISAEIDEIGSPIIIVKDNGPGIQPNNLEQIFIPFFTTKPDGSGIGLSLSKQIMRLHEGALDVSSFPGADTVFTLRFRQ